MILSLLLCGLTAAPDPWELVERAQAARHIPLEAELVATVWGRTPEGFRSTTKQFRLRQGNGSFELRSVGDGPHLWERGGILTLDGPKGKPRHMRPPPMEEFHPDLARANYQAVYEHEDTVAGRLCHVIRLRPLHTGGAGQRLWIDKTMGMPLARDQFLDDGTLTRRLRTTRVHLLDSASLGTLPAPPAIPPAPQLHSRQEALAWLGFPVELPRRIPQGYQLSGYYADRCPDETNALRMTWSDGLATFSVILHPRDCGRPPMPPDPGFLERIRRSLRLGHHGPRIPPPLAVGRLGPDLEVIAVGDPRREMLLEVLRSMDSPQRPFQEMPDRKKPFPPVP